MEKNNDFKEKMMGNKLPQLISYFSLRKIVGILGITFPIVLVIGSVSCGCYNEVQPSISHYYHTNMHDVFVGILCAIALFFFAYRGYDKIDSVVCNLACVFALGVAFFPTTHIGGTSTILNNLHYVSAAGLFLMLAYISMVLFTKTGKGEKPKAGEMKYKRNILYRICGYIMLTCIGLIAFESLIELPEGDLNKYKPTFWLETIALWAFGISWLVKGNALLTDKD